VRSAGSSGANESIAPVAPPGEVRGAARRERQWAALAAGRWYPGDTVAHLAPGLSAALALVFVEACSLLAPSDAELRGERDVDASAAIAHDGAASGADGATDGAVAADGGAVQIDAAGGGAACTALCAVLPSSCRSSPCACPANHCGNLTCTAVGANTTFGCDGVSCTITATTVTCTDGTTFCRCA
jgi:hypothetical protein